MVRARRAARGQAEGVRERRLRGDAIRAPLQCVAARHFSFFNPAPTNGALLGPGQDDLMARRIVCDLTNE
jgi:hypothetical protein